MWMVPCVGVRPREKRRCSCHRPTSPRPTNPDAPVSRMSNGATLRPEWSGTRGRDSPWPLIRPHFAVMGRRRVALLDNTVNASYVTAKILRRMSVEADLIQSRGAPFNHQPFWEDMDLVETTEDGTTPRRSGYWDAQEE